MRGPERRNVVAVAFVCVAASMLLLGLTPFAASASSSAGPKPPNGSLATPTLTSVSPNPGYVGALETFTGTNFVAPCNATFSGAPATDCTVVSATTVTATVPPGAMTGHLTLFVSGQPLMTSFTVTTPTFTSFSPLSGPVGTTVTFTGTGFIGPCSVMFNGTAASKCTVVTPTTVTVKVPNGATTGPVTFTIAGSTFSGTTFTLPTYLASFDPSSGAVTTPVTVSGNGFTAPCSVAFNGVASPCTFTSASQITTAVPKGATTGPITLTTNGAVLTSKKFTVVPTTLTSFAPSSAPVGRTVTLTGTGFIGPCSVMFDGTTAPACKVTSTTKVTTTVPVDAATGPIVLSVAGSVLTSSTAFTVSLGLSLSDTTGPPTTGVTVSGSAFGPNQAVDVYIGTTDQALVVSDGNGNFSFNGLVIPASAQPGTAWITAVERANGLSAQTPFTVQTDWKQTGFGPTHRGTNPYENTINTSNVSSIDRDWSFAAAAAITSSPTVVNGIVYFGSQDDHFYAVDATTGAEIWSFATGGDVESSPAVVNGIVYLGSDDHSLYALNAATGAPIWSFVTGGAVASSPTVANGTVYFGSLDDSVYALDAATGAKTWSHATGFGAGVVSSPAVANGVVYVGAQDGTFYALRSTDGSTMWSIATGGGISSSAAVANGVVYFGSSDDKVYAINATNGALIWSFTTGGVVESSPAVVNGTVYVGSDDDSLYALNAHTGTRIWSTATGNAVTSAPVVANGLVYAGSFDDALHAFSASNGVQLSRYTTGGVVHSLAVANGVVYFGSSDDHFYALDLAGGTDHSESSAAPSIRSLRPDRSLRVSRGA